MDNTNIPALIAEDIHKSFGHLEVLKGISVTAAVGDVKIDVSDTQALYSNVVGWIRSDVGGLRLARNLGKFLLAVSGFWLLGIVVGKIVDKALRMTRITVELMRSVIVRTVRRGIMLVGMIIGSAIAAGVRRRERRGRRHRPRARFRQRPGPRRTAR